MEQNSFIIDPKTDLPIGFKMLSIKENTIVEVDTIMCLKIIAEYHLRSCIFANVKICGITAGSCTGQWEFQIGICEGIEMGTIAYGTVYFTSLCGLCNIKVSLEPKPLKETMEWVGLSYEFQYHKNEKWY